MWTGIRTSDAGLRMCVKSLDDQPGWYQVVLTYENLVKHLELPKPILLELQASVSWAPTGPAA